MPSDELVEKYKKELESRLHPSLTIEKPEASYSRTYQIFKKERIGRLHTLYEKLCNASERAIRLKLKSKDIEKIMPFLKMAHINATPQGVYSFAVIQDLLD